MMSAVFLSKKIDHQPTWSDRIMAKLEANYKKALEFILHFPKIVLGFVISLFIVALFILSRLGGEFIPALEEGDFAIDTRVLTGSNLTTTVESTQKAASLLLKEYPEIEKIVTKIGSGEVPTDPMPMEASDLMVILKPKEEWTSAKTFNELADKMGATMSAVPGITTGFQFPVQMRFNELMTGARQDVVCKIFGENLDTLAAYASSIGKIAGTVEGAKSIYVEAVTGMPQILIEYNRNTIAQYNLNIQDINKVVNAAFAGQSSGLLFEGEKRFDLVVRIKGDLKKDLKDIQQLLIPTPSGIQVPLSQLASVEIKDGPNQIQREDAKRRIVIGFNVRGRDVETIVKELQQKIEKQVKFPVGYYITYGGAFENLNAAKARLMIAVPVSLLLIFLLLYFAFNSIKHGLLIYSAIPLSAIGGIFFLALRDMPFSISAGVGFIALFGVAVLNGIVLIAEFNRLKNDGMDNLRTIVLTGTSLRLRPVLMTAFVASLGFLPMALSNGAGAEVQRPLATVVIGGLMIATFLTLFVLPVLYMMFEKGFNASLPINKGVAILLGCLLVGSVAIAQNDSVRLYSAQPISVQAAVDSALKNNLLVKNEQLKMQYQQMLIGTAGNLPKTSVIGEIGQINSIYTDTRLGISQSIAFPTFYKRERALLAAEFKNSVLNIAIQEALLKKQVQQVYYNMVYLQKKKELLLFADSLYSAFYQKAALRLKTGESNILEKTSAETLLGQIKIQVQQLNQDAAIMQLQLQLLLNTKFAYQPETNRGPLNPASLLDTALLRNHPVLQSMLQQQSIAMANTEVEKSKLLPDLSVGILNGSIRGVGADNIFYSGKRFSSVQVGMGIPLFTKAQKARINSAALSEKMAESKYEQVKQQLTTEYQTAIAQFSKYLATVQYLEKTGLKNAQLITETANKQLSAGSINYLEWVQLINQATSVKNDYTEAVRSLNESIIQLTYYIQQ